jgi:hypothetical protein
MLGIFNKDMGTSECNGRFALYILPHLLFERERERERGKSQEWRAIALS